MIPDTAEELAEKISKGSWKNNSNKWRSVVFDTTGCANLLRTALISERDAALEEVAEIARVHKGSIWTVEQRIRALKSSLSSHEEKK